MTRPYRTGGGNSPYLRPGQVAAIFQCNLKTVSRWAKEGKLPYIKTLGGHRRYKAEDIYRLAEDLKGPTPEEAADARA